MSGRFWYGMVAAAVVLAVSPSARAVYAVGDKPELHFKAANGGDEISLDKYKGHIIVIDFWATWCGPCMAEAGHMVQINNKYAPQGLQFIGVSLDQSVDPLLKVAKEKGFNWPQMFEQGSGVSGRYGVDSIPRTFIIGPEGTLLWTGHPSGIDAALADAFKNHPPQLVDPKMLADATAVADKVEAAIKDGNQPATLKLLASIPAAARKDKDFAARLTEIEKQVDDYAAKALTEIDPLIENKQYSEASAKLAELIRNLSGLPAADNAKKRLAELLAKPEVKAQFEAAQRSKAAEEELAVAKRLQGDKKNEQAYLKFKAVAKTFAGTPAGDQAAQAVADYEKNPALVKSANDGIIAGKAKAMLGMAKNYATAGRADMAKKKYQEVIAAYPNTEHANEAKAAIDEIDRNAGR